MPRTKRRHNVTRASQSSDVLDTSCNDPLEAWLKDCDRQFALSQKKLRSVMTGTITKLRNRHRQILAIIGSTKANSPIEDDTDGNIMEMVMELINAKPESQKPVTEIISTGHKARKRSFTESHSDSSADSLPSIMRSVSADSRSENRRVKFPSSPDLESKDAGQWSSKPFSQFTNPFYKTPANHIVTTSGLSTITPKVKPDSKFVVYRYPQMGEMALSMQGSPLLVSAPVNNQMNAVTVPMPDGKVLSLMPRHCSPREIAELDVDTRQQLQEVHKNLSALLGLPSN